MRLWPRRGRIAGHEGQPRVLVPFIAKQLDLRVLEAALRIARAEGAVLVPAYLLVVPLEFGLDAPVQHGELERALPILEAVELAARRAGVPVDARIERGRTPIDALQRLWEAEPFDRTIVPAPRPGQAGFTPKDLAWMLTSAPSETLILRPAPDAPSANGDASAASIGRGVSDGVTL